MTFRISRWTSRYRLPISPIPARMRLRAAEPKRSWRLSRSEQPTLRQLLAKLAGARGHFTIAGPPEKIADIMQDWFETGAADGFNLMPPVLPHQLDLFISEVVAAVAEARPVPRRL